MNKSPLFPILLTVISLVVACQRADESVGEDVVLASSSQGQGQATGAFLPYERAEEGQVLARVGENKLTKKDVEAELSMQEALYNRKTKSLDRQDRFAKMRLPRASRLVQQFVSHAVLLDLARKSSVTPDEASRRTLEARYLKKFGSRGETFEALCKSLGAAEAVFRDRFEFDLLTDSYMRMQHGAELKMSDEEVATRQAHYKKLSVAGAATNELVRVRANEVLSKARAGEDFARLSDTYSEDEGDHEPGGVLGACTASSFQQEPEVWTAVAGLKENEVTDVIETDYAFYIYKRTQPKDPDEIVAKGEVYLSEIYFRKAQVFPDYTLEQVREIGEKERYEELLARLIREHRATLEVEPPQMARLFPPAIPLKEVKEAK